MACGLRYRRQGSVVRRAKRLIYCCRGTLLCYHIIAVYVQFLTKAIVTISCLNAIFPLPVSKVRLDRDTSQDAPLRKHSPASGGQRLRHHHPRFRHQRPYTARPRPYLLRMDATNRNHGQTAREQSDVRLRSPGHLHGAVGLRGLDIRHPQVTRMDVVGV